MMGRKSRWITIKIDKENPEPENMQITFADDKGEWEPTTIEEDVKEPLKIGQNVEYMDRIIYYVLASNGCVWIDRRRV